MGMDSSSVFQSAGLRELAHHALLLFREVFGHGDRDLDDEIATVLGLRNALPPYPEAFSRRSPGRYADRHLLLVQCLHADLRAERGLGDVERHGRDDVEPLALEEAIGLDVKRDEEVARGPALHA